VEFWRAKFTANQQRDRRAIDALRALGFRVVVVWECEVEERPALVRRRLAGLKRP
jgi:DNA mismatch endonuclease (patch repair protein)